MSRSCDYPCTHTFVVSLTSITCCIRLGVVMHRERSPRRMTSLVITTGRSKASSRPMASTPPRIPLPGLSQSSTSMPTASNVAQTIIYISCRSRRATMARLRSEGGGGRTELRRVRRRWAPDCAVTFLMTSLPTITGRRFLACVSRSPPLPLIHADVGATS